MKKLGLFLSIAVFGVVFAACSGTTKTESDVMVEDDSAMMEETSKVVGDDAMMVDDEYAEGEEKMMKDDGYEADSKTGDAMMDADADLDVMAQ